MLLLLVGCKTLNLANPIQDWSESRTFLHAGDEATKEGHHTLALEQYQKASQLTPNDPVILERLSESNWELGNRTRAINQMAMAANSSGHDPSKLSKLAQMNYEFGDLNRALQAIMRVLDQDAQAIESRILRARIYKQLNLPSKALDDLHFVLGKFNEEDYDQYVPLQLEVANIYIQQRRFQNALSIVTTIPVVKLEDGLVVRVLQTHALALQQLGRLEDARERLELALKHDGSHEDTYYRLAELHLSKDNLAGASLALQQALKHAPDHAAAQQLLQQLQANSPTPNLD